MARVLDYGFWQSNYHGDPAILGKHIVISGQPVVVAGVLPNDFHGIFVGFTTELYLPAHFTSPRHHAGTRSLYPSRDFSYAGVRPIAAGLPSPH